MGGTSRVLPSSFKWHTYGVPFKLSIGNIGPQIATYFRKIFLPFVRKVEIPTYQKMYIIMWTTGNDVIIYYEDGIKSIIFAVLIL